MGYMNQANDISQSKIVTNTFYGLDRRKKIADGLFTDMENMTCDDYPIIRTRDCRTRTGDVYDCSISKHMLVNGEMKDCIMSISDDGVNISVTYIDDVYGVHTVINAFPDGKSPFKASDKRQIVSIGANIAVFPDGVVANSSEDVFDSASWKNINTTYSTRTSFDIAPCDAEGNILSLPSSTKPETPKNGDRYVSTTDVGTAIYEWDAATQKWVSVQTYVRIKRSGIGKDFNAGDVVDISGLYHSSEYSIVYGTPNLITEDEFYQQLEALNGTKEIIASGDSWIVITGMLLVASARRPSAGGADLIVNRGAPDMDYVCECNNRLWGCKYGFINGKLINELYCCALGDPFNWRQYQGLSTDSWAASCGTDGEWTGCATYNGYPTFFKEKSITRIYVSNTGAHQTYDAFVPGVQSGSHESIATVNGIMYYKGVAGVYAYDGGYPVIVSQQLGKTAYREAVAKGCGDKLYISMTDGQEWALFTYDTAKGLWCKEDDTHAIGMGVVEGVLVINGGAFYDPSVRLGEQHQEQFDWMTTSGIEYFGDNVSNRYKSNYPPSAMYVSRYVFRMVLGENTTVSLYMEYDSSGEWELEGEFTGKPGMGVSLIPVRPKRCDHLRYKLEGTGYAELWTVSRTLEVGAEV